MREWGGRSDHYLGHRPVVVLSAPIYNNNALSEWEDCFALLLNRGCCRAIECFRGGVTLQSELNDYSGRNDSLQCRQTIRI